MGLNICGIIVNKLPNISENQDFDKKKLKTKFQKTTLKKLSPKDLSISFKDNCTIILLDLIFYQNLSEEAELTNLENDVAQIFPNSKFIIIAINDTIDFTGYSLIENGIKLRTKAVVKDDIFLDFGELNLKESELYIEVIEKIKKFPESYAKLEQKYSSLSDTEKKKYYIRTRDNIYKNSGWENEFNYTNGQLDNFVIESEFYNLLNCDYFELENIKFIEFERRKLNFKKDSLREYLFIAKNNL